MPCANSCSNYRLNPMRGRRIAPSPSAPAPAGEPAQKAAPVKHKRKAAVAKPISEPTVALVPGPAEVEPAQNAAPVKHKRKAAVAKPISEPTVALVPGPAEVAVKNVNVRGQAGLKGEVVAHLVKGDAVTVLGQIN